jgi:hypothetical protein
MALTNGRPTEMLFEGKITTRYYAAYLRETYWRKLESAYAVGLSQSAAVYKVTVFERRLGRETP